MDTINLLPQVAEAEIEKGVYKKKANLFAIAALLLTGVVVVVLFGLQLFYSTRERALDQDIETEISTIRSMQDIEIKHRAFVDKLESIQAYLDKNKSTAKAFKKLIDLANSGSVSLNRVEVNTSGEITIAGTSATSTNLGSFFDSLTDAEAKIDLNNVIANSVAQNQGAYQFTVRLDYTKLGLLQPQEEEVIR